MAFLKMSSALRGSLAGLVAVAASSATFGAEAEGVVRIRSNDQQATGTVIRGQSPDSCLPFVPAISSANTRGAAPSGTMLITPRETLAPEPRVTGTSGERVGIARISSETTMPSAEEPTGDYAGLFSSESAAPFDKPMQFAELSPAEPQAMTASNGAVEQAGHRREARRCKHGRAAGQCPQGCPAEACQTVPSNCPPVYYGECPPGHECGSRVVFGHTPLSDKLRCHCINHRMKNRQTSDALARMFHEDCEEKFSWFRCKFGYFFPNGSGGKGTAVAGHYSMVYPVNPDYQDPRDCQVYAAQGYYGPVAVPLAPVVNHTYNYGWGVPSSRLTPVSHPIAAPYPAPQY
ncbi:hypothetical protein Pan44_04870 [Caulifigura coniformis]|uniref:Uncharacterized protein n=2 Tax=Caulifigura coniformis TaxID=2527983 RepID=A0A517S8M8_9PLAN|nr:hypothetical protein Pan44_04870 [Caulifigura coniformis]